jgi:glycosyltransferase involved in cell wall biosynthesis
MAADIFATHLGTDRVPRIYFDVSDIVHFATRYNRVTGIQRVQFNIITLLAHKHGGDAIRCVFFDRTKKAMFEFDPAKRPAEFEFDAEQFLLDLGLARASKVFPSKVQIKSYLRRYNHNKLLRTYKKIGVYCLAIFRPRLLLARGVLLPGTHAGRGTVAPVTELSALPVGSHLVSLGALWFTPDVWKFAQNHRDQEGDVVQMVYDLIPILHPEYYSPTEPLKYKAWLDSSLKYASRFICISNWTASDLGKYSADMDCRPVIQAIPLAHEFLGFDHKVQPQASTQVEFLTGTKYVLCVGTIESRKNGMALLDIWQQLIEELEDKTPLLVFAGKLGKGGAEFQERLNASDALTRFVRLVYAPSDQDIAWLYSNSLFTTYLSKTEGWGLPVGESAWFGKFCLASQATSIPEVCGDLMDYVDPYDMHSIKAGLRRALMDDEYLKSRERRIVEAKLRLWSDVANDIYAFIEAK